MLVQPECIDCILRMALGAIRKLDIDESQVRQLYDQILSLDILKGNIWHRTSPEAIEGVMIAISAFMNDPDPFYQEKQKLNQIMLESYPFFEALVANDADPLKMAVKLAIIGNTIDFMLPQRTENIEAAIKAELKNKVADLSYIEFKKAILTARRIVYFSDNAGEIVLDKLLVETIRRYTNPQFVFVVRNIPTLNDATPTEARQIGLDQIAPLISNGIDGPVPGTILKRCSSEVKDQVDRADLIISKGGGNFDCLSEDLARLGPKVSFLLLSKCIPYNRFFSKYLYQPVIFNYFKEE